MLENVTRLLESATEKVIGGSGRIPNDKGSSCASHWDRIDLSKLFEESMLSTELVNGTAVSKKNGLR